MNSSVEINSNKLLTTIEYTIATDEKKFFAKKINSEKNSANI